MNRIQKMIVKAIWIATAAAVLGAGILMFAVSEGWFGELPNIYEITNPKPKLASEIYSEDGILLGKFYRDYDRIQTDYSQISPYVINALVATEDERFYTHPGIDVKSLFRAVFFLGTQGGASTITQQLAKNMFSNMKERGWSRIFDKLKEWIIAIKLERHFSKQEILTLYLNTVPFGDNIYGIRNASLTFFQKKPYELSIDQASLLIGILKSNTTYNPRLHPEAAFARRNVVLEQTCKNGYITEGMRDSAMRLPIKLNYLKLDEREGIATYFREHVRNQIKAWIDRYEARTGKRFNLYQDGLKIYTTINSKMQAYAERSAMMHLTRMQNTFNQQIKAIEKDYWKSLDSIVGTWKKQTERYISMSEQGISPAAIDKSFYKKQRMTIFSWDRGDIDTFMTPLDSLKYYKKMLQIGALFVNPMNGKVKAWIGGINYKIFKYDHVSVAKRQVGSTIKPLLYALAMDKYDFKAQTLCSNMPQCFPSGADNELWCTRNNYGSRSDSITSFAEGIIFSLNNVSAFVLRHVTPNAFADFLSGSLKIKSKIYPYPSLALGTSEFSLYEMVRAYTIFPSNGVLTDLQTIIRIEDSHGKVIQEFSSPEKDIVLSESTAYTMSEIMQGTVNYGTARRFRNAFDARGEVAGKTGTTNDFSDAWFIGFNNKMLAGVWVGCEDKIISFRSKEGEGASMALPVVGQFWQYCSQDKGLDFTPTSFKKPLGMDEDVYATVSKLGRNGLDAYLTQQAKEGGIKDSSLYQFVLNDPYKKKIWGKENDSVVQGEGYDDIFEEALKNQKK